MSGNSPLDQDGTEDAGACLSAPGSHASHEAPEGLRPSGFDPSRNKPQKQVKAFAVCEHDERSGGIYFARHAIVARKAGANEYGDGELSYVTCNRAPWADRFADTGVVPAAVMVEHGWHFECAACGARIDDDFPYRWRDRKHGSFRELLQQARRWKRWSPTQVQGSQHTSVFCDKQCESDWHVEQAERRRVEARTLTRFKKIVQRRFPDAEIVEGDDRWMQPHVYVTRNRGGRIVPRQVVVAFNFPGMKHGPASLRWDHRSEYRGGKPHWSCCNGDKDAFEAWARRDRDGSGEAGETGTGSTEGDSAGRVAASPDQSGAA